MSHYSSKVLRRIATTYGKYFKSEDEKCEVALTWDISYIENFWKYFKAFSFGLK